MVLGGGRVFVCTQKAQLNLGDGLILELCLELHVHNIEVHVVVCQLMAQVERCKVADVELVGVERSRRVERIAVGVDVEVSAHLTRKLVGFLIGSARCLLLAVACIANHI